MNNRKNPNAFLGRITLTGNVGGGERPLVLVPFTALDRLRHGRERLPRLLTREGKRAWV